MIAATKTKLQKVIKGLGLGLFSFLGVVVPAKFILADWDTVLKFFYLLIGYLFALILDVEMEILILSGKTFNYVFHNAPDITGDPAVIAGWGITRDVLNMFFVISLLIIAFATILRIESYQYKVLLPKLIYAAILVNFSKTIAGIFIDFSNALMSTFINIKGYTYSETISMAVFGKMPSEVAGAAWNLNSDSGSADFIAGALFALVAQVVVVALVMIALSILTVAIIVRNVALMVLVVLSPAAFVLNILPATQSYAKRWWDEFLKYVFYGPVAAFLLYLSCMVAYNITQSSNNQGLLKMPNYPKGELRTGGSILTADGMYQVALVITLLYLAILMSQALAPMAAGIATGLQKKALGLGLAVAWGATKKGGRVLDRSLAFGEKGIGSVPGRIIGGLAGGAVGLFSKQGVKGKAKAWSKAFGEGTGKFARIASPKTIAQAWERRQTELDRKAYTKGAGWAHKQLNRIPFSGDSTDYAMWAQMEEEDMERQKLRKTYPSGDADALMGALITSVDNGDDARSAAATQELFRQKNLNEIFRMLAGVRYKAENSTGKDKDKAEKVLKMFHSNGFLEAQRKALSGDKDATYTDLMDGESVNGKETLSFNAYSKTDMLTHMFGKKRAQQLIMDMGNEGKGVDDFSMCNIFSYDPMTGKVSYNPKDQGKGGSSELSKLPTDRQMGASRFSIAKEEYKAADEEMVDAISGQVVAEEGDVYEDYSELEGAFEETLKKGVPADWTLRAKSMAAKTRVPIMALQKKYIKICKKLIEQGKTEAARNNMNYLKNLFDNNQPPPIICKESEREDRIKEFNELAAQREKLCKDLGVDGTANTSKKSKKSTT